MVARIVIGMVIGVSIADVLVGIGIESRCVANENLSFALALVLVGSLMGLYAIRDSLPIEEESRRSAPCIEPHCRPYSRNTCHSAVCTLFCLACSVSIFACRVYPVVRYSDCWNHSTVLELVLCSFVFFCLHGLLFCRCRRLCTSQDVGMMILSHASVSPSPVEIASVTVSSP